MHATAWLLRQTACELTHLVIGCVQPQDGSETEEICTQYNILKIARYLFRWTGAAALADFYERAILNGLIGTQRMPPGYQASAYTAPEPSAAANAPLGGGVLPLAAPAEGTRSRTLLQQG